MDIVFEKDYLAELYYNGKASDKKHRFQPEIVKRYKLRIETLEAANNIEDLLPIKSLHYEVLKGNKDERSSIRVNNQYRIEFTVNESESKTTAIICNIIELSNHYK